MLRKQTTDDSRYVDILLYKEMDTVKAPAKSSCYAPFWQRFVAWLGIFKNEAKVDEEDRVSIIEELI
jgi:hypothetical protein